VIAVSRELAKCVLDPVFRAGSHNVVMTKSGAIAGNAVPVSF
jgi:hypothetical protein